MPITDQFTRIPIASITIDRQNRQRRHIETVSLERSIAKTGLISPIIIDRALKLHAGERRLTACKNLGHSDIIVRFVEDLSEIEAQIVELEENIKRTDLEWEEIVQAVGRVHQLYRAQSADWTAEDTGDSLGLSYGVISRYLQVFGVLDDPRIADSASINEAYNKIKRREQRAAGDALEEILGVADVVVPDNLQQSPPPPSEGEMMGQSMTLQLPPVTARAVPKPLALDEIILNGSFLEWAPLYDGPKFNFIHCDFPYGIDLFAGPQARAGEPGKLYEDTPELYWGLLDCLLTNLDRLMSLSGHLMFWYSMKHHNRTVQIFADHASNGLKFNPFPLVWVKSDGAGIASDPRFTPRHIYETCLLARRSDRNLQQIKADAYSAPTDRHLHPSTKPEPMLRHFMEMLVDETTSMLDPTCGSGAALRAADSLGAKKVIGIEIDSECCDVARKAFKNARLLRGAAAAL